MHGDNRKSIQENDEDFEEVFGGDKMSTKIECQSTALNGFHQNSVENEKRHVQFENIKFSHGDEKMKRGQLTADVADMSPDRLVGSNFKGAQSAAAKRREYGISLQLSNVVPMSPKIVNGSFAAMFDDDSSNFDLSRLCRQLTVAGEYIHLSPRKRGMLGDGDRQMSLDYGVLSASRKQCPMRMKLMGSLDSKIDDILELGNSSDNGEKNKSDDDDSSVIESEQPADGKEKMKNNQSVNNSDNKNNVEGESTKQIPTKIGCQNAKDQAMTGNGRSILVNGSPGRPKRRGNVKVQVSKEDKGRKEKLEGVSVRIHGVVKEKQNSKDTPGDDALMSDMGGFCPHCGRGNIKEGSANI